MVKSKGLGKGLSALLGDNNDDENIVDLKNFKSDKTPIHQLVPNKFQPRKNFEKKQLEELAVSIKNRGIIQPIAVRKISDNKFEIIAGERRWRAAQLANMHEVPTVILDANDELAAEFAVLENVQREGLNALEEAEGYQTLINTFGYTQDKIAEMIGKSRAYIANMLRLKKLPNEIQNMVTNGLLTAGHARSLIDVDKNIELAKVIINKNLSVRQSELLSKKNPKSYQSDKEKSIDPNVKDLQNSLELKTGMKVNINYKKNNTGKITFEYKDLDQLNKFIANVKSKY
ncbi:MAG: chromosome partitioning protein ParB [Pelagibacteraceae bacterium]|jgi:ParB family chromosome partitioning protein|nr:chromosome partitioning protein ParB [Pelagibacteraceae bacterium]RZO88722.1 MAG: ParB/RepB/Spo0J family partition protein [alpha proteobacterium HIMB114]|tara:strand:+ start:1477 stop:2337 length:861 start_codon:yes stop_codon:yes gene_type:complete